MRGDGIRPNVLPLSSFDDVALVELVQIRDADAFGELFDRYQRLVYCIIFRLIDDSGISEDLVQTVFLKLWRSPSAFRGGVFSAWIARVSRNCALDELRRRKDLIGLPPTVNREITTTDELALTEIETQQLHNAVRSLSLPQRSLIKMTFFEDMTHSEIAETTRIPLGTVKTRIRAGLRALRIALNDVARAPIETLPLRSPERSRRAHFVS